MKPERLIDIKKELLSRSATDLTDICLRLAKYKKENKELLNYLLYNAENPMAFAEMVKSSLEDEFKMLPKGYYYSTKALRKMIRTINRYAKYTGSKEVELELSLWFCRQFLLYADLKTNHKPLQGLFLRQMEKISKLIPKLHEDLQFDYRQDYTAFIEDVAVRKIRWINNDLL